MNNVSITTTRKKKSIISILLIAILSLTFNYGPLSLFAPFNLFANAYRSESIQSYYGDAQKETESNIGSANYPASLADYFKNSSNNFNIGNYYRTRYTELFSEKVTDFLVNGNLKVNLDDSSEQEYKTLLDEFLKSKNNGYATLYDYYDANSRTLNSDTGATDFVTYFEYFVTHTISYGDGNAKHIPALFPPYSETSTQHLSELYNVFADYLETKETQNSDTEVEFEDFHAESAEYKRVKTLIDDEIVKTVAIYSYDGATQDKIMAGIFANDAPTKRNYYFSGTSCETVDRTVEATISNFVTGTATGGKKQPTIYYFHEESNVDDLKTKLSADGVETNNKSLFDPEDISVRNEDILKYRVIRKGEYGYVDGYTTYYRYNNSVYEVLSGSYSQVYFLTDETPDADLKATLDSLYIKTFTKKEFEDDINRTSIDPKAGQFYVQIPFKKNSTIDGEFYFRTIYGLSASSTETLGYKNFVNLFTTEDGQSLLYFKLQASSIRKVYIDKTNLEAFKAAYPDYGYEILQMPDDAISDQYMEVTSTYSDYYKKDFKLYFKRQIEYYTETNVSDEAYLTDEDGEFIYETKAVPNIPYEKRTIPTSAYELDEDQNKKIYVLSETPVEGYETVTQAELDSAANRNFYVKVPDSVASKLNGTDKSYTYYYKHKPNTGANQIYLVDDSESAQNNEIYKNLYYNVITTSEYNANFADYTLITSSDPNYNKNFRLYYKYDYAALGDSDLYVKNLLRKDIGDVENTNKNSDNAIFIIDDSLTTTRRNEYKNLNYTVITTAEYNANSAYYVQIDENDSNYNTSKTRLYYKYNEDRTTKTNVVYIYSSSSSTKYKRFYNTDAGYVADDYELIKAGDPDYVEGLELYHKKLRGTENQTNEIYQDTYYYYQSSSVSVRAKSFYAITFYVYTNNAEASFYVVDNSKILTDIKLEHINTDGKWVKYALFIASDSLSTSSIMLQLYMGDRTNIAGSEYESESQNQTVNGVVLYDEIKIVKINETDFVNRSIDGVKVKDKTKDDDGINFVDEFGNEVVVANDDPTLSEGNTFDFRKFIGSEVEASSNGDETYDTTFAGLVDFDTMFSSPDALLNNMNFVEGTDGFTPYTELWQYYISRADSGQGSSDTLEILQNAYAENHAKVSLISEADIFADKQKAKEEEEKEKEDSEDDNNKDTDEREDVTIVESTFKSDNKVLKIENTNRLLTLGIVSNKFKLDMAQYYKITVWIYSPDKDAKAVVGINSYVKTSGQNEKDKVLSTTAEVNANIRGFATAPTNEYGWIPVSLFVEGSALRNQDCYLVLEAYKDSTIYFDNITIEKTTSSAYDTANSDSDSTTSCLSLTGTFKSSGVTNGYFNNINVTDNFNDIDYSKPRTAKNWTVESGNSANVVAGVVSTTADYTSHSGNFFEKYADNNIPTTDYSPNVFAIHATGKLTPTLPGLKNGTEVDITSVYKIHSSSISLSSNSVYKISFKFLNHSLSNGSKMIAKLYYGSVDNNKIIAAFELPQNSEGKDTWQTYNFYVATGTSSASVYLQLGVENAVGTCYFQEVLSSTESDSLDKIQDNLIGDVSAPSESGDIFDQNISSLNVRFADLSNTKFSMHGAEKDSETGLYAASEFTQETNDTNTYTTGDVGVAVASFYETTVKYKYTVTINSTEYYLAEKLSETGEPELDANGNPVYLLYSDSNCTNLVEKIDGKEVIIKSNKTVVLGTDKNAAEYSTSKKEVRTHDYYFTNGDDDEMIVVNNVFIQRSELNNKHSQNVLILANSYSTDYTVVTPSYSNTLRTSAFYALRIYVKTSNFDAADFGLNIDISAISTSWENINTTTVNSDSKSDENGFVCYQVLITSNTSSISNLSVKFSLGSTKTTGTGYAIIAGAELETFDTEKLFNEYSENYKDDETTTKRYYGTVSSSDEEEEPAADDVSTWATFFYVFSSILLGVAIIVALVAVIIKKHPVKISTIEKNEHDRDSNLAISTTSSKPKDTPTKEEKKSEARGASNGDDEGFI